jgi:glutamate-1-semialdehyde 2,1-aminomutase
MNPSRSRAAHERACRVIPGGVNSPARAFGGVGGTPITMARGEGPVLIDVDGVRRLDYIGSWGPLILGHCHPRVIAAVTEALHQGSSFGAPTEREAELAELVIHCFPAIEQVRFTSSGTEAAMTAVRLARGFTGRDTIIKFAGCYHGHVDSLLVQAGSSATTLGVPNSPGIPRGATQDTLVLEYNDADAVADVCRRHGDRLAAVLLEPVVGNMGLVPPRPGYLEALRELTTQCGALLIFDEVMTGFRLSLGGAQELFGVRPDLTVLGKIIGGGLPVGAVGGRRDIMQRLAPAGPVFQAGTLSGNPLAMAAGIATLRELIEHPPYAELERRTGLLAQGLTDAAHAGGIPHQVQRVGSMITLFFIAEPVVNYTTALRADTRAFARFFWRLMERGVYWPCSQFEAAFVSSAHTDDHIRATLQAAAQALQPG